MRILRQRPITRLWRVWISWTGRCALGLAILACSVPAFAQFPTQRRGPPIRARPDTGPTRSDSARALADSAARDSALVKWSSPDSTMASLMKRPGYTVTRYQATTVSFNAITDAIALRFGSSDKQVAVQRGSQVVVADTSITYNERTKEADVRGKRIVVSDPTSGQADVVGSGQLTYSLADRSGHITNPTFSIVNGTERWFIRADVGKPVLGDSLHGKATAFYGRGGQLTSCTDSIPDYHFEFKELKRSSTNTLVARPAVLYIRDVPVLWLPFIFQDTRAGRHSGILTPRFGLSDIIRNSPSYRRNVEDFGYYFAVNDYMDARLALDWRSSAGATPQDPGWMRYKGEWNYRWLDRFIDGHLATDYTRQRDGLTNLAVNLMHTQEFSRDARLNADMNYVTSTQLQRQNSFNPYAVLATISSQVAFTDKLGPAQFSLGGTRKQYPGRQQLEQTLPTFSLTTGPLALSKSLTWTPNLSYSASSVQHIDQPGPFTQFYRTNPATGFLDSTAINRSQSNSTLSFDTPLQIFGYDLRNSFHVTDQRNNFPQQFQILDVTTGAVRDTRVFARTYNTGIDWTPDFQLPPFARSLFNLSPSVSLQNVDPGPFWIRTERTNGRFVHQSKRPSFGVSATPTIFGLLPGFGPFLRFRHSLTPSLSYSYAPGAAVDTAYLAATGRTKAGYLGSLIQNTVSFGLQQNIEAKVRNPTDTNPDASRKIKLLSMQFTPLSYNIEQARYTHRPLSGFTTDNFGYTVRSDLLPGFDLQVDYSLFQGSVLSDTARFKPYRDRVAASFSLSQDQNPFIEVSKLFGRAVPPAAGPTNGLQPDSNRAFQRRLADQPVAGSRGLGGTQYVIPPSKGWQASFTFSSARPRPPVGGHPIYFDPAARCQQLQAFSPFFYNQCITNAQTTPSTDTPIQGITAGAQPYVIPPTTSLGSSLTFPLTEKWAASWQTTYDLERHEFASHIVSLQRDLHDWRAVFAFTQSPNGNFSFNFFIALKAEQDLKFNYNRATIRNSGGYVTPY